jgi:predicted CXXCH cytochrome family protein
MVGLSFLKGIAQKLRFRPSSCPSLHGRVDVLSTAAAGSLSHGERAGVRGVALSVVLLAAFFAVALAGASARAESNLVPHPPKGAGEKCVADTNYMRRYHMMMLKHERDETVHEGVRGGKYSIKECVDCHAVKGADGQPVKYESPQHFCRSCHDYAAVSIDCFECHASRPGDKSKSSAAMPDAGTATALANYAQGSHP